MVEFENSHVENLSVTPKDIRVVVMAGGIGSRLRSVTGGLIPKDFVEIDTATGVRLVDIRTSMLENLGLDDVIYSANNYLSLYQDELASTDYSFHFQEPGDNHGLDMKKIIHEYGLDKQYLILPTDIYIVESDLNKFISNHRKNSITRGVTGSKYKELGSYHNMYVDQDNNAIVGDSRSEYSKQRIDPDSVALFTSSPITLLDPELYLHMFDVHKRLCHKDNDVDLWLDVGFLLAEVNRRNIERGNESKYRICEFDGPMVDFGTPETLQLAREVYKQINSV